MEFVAPHPFEYYPNDPVNIAARENDLDEGIDYEQILIEMAEDARIGRPVMRFDSHEEFSAWFQGVCDQIVADLDRDDPLPHAS